MIKTLVDYNDPILKEEMPVFNFQDFSAKDIETICNDLIDSLKHYKGIGLSANQINMRHRVFVLWTNPTIVAFNPRIVYESEEMTYEDEGCLSYPGVTMKIKRPLQIRARYHLPNGEIHTNTFKGLTAKAFHHEMDHLNGKTFFERANFLHKEKGLKKLKKYSRMIKRSEGVRPSLNTPHTEQLNINMDGVNEVLFNKNIRS